ncbi:MAG: hypothetical protein FWB91_10115 [Defluviitaleaceae bacterium]|nr:hypothetical protein [Defluviitaleaceae bacterium]
MEKGNTYGGTFCSPDEHQITTIGTGYIANFLTSIASGTGVVVEQAGATLTNKRIYFSGNAFSFNDKGQLTSTKEQKIVNVRDVTGVGYKLFSPIQYVIWAVTVLVLGIMGMALTMEEVWYGGGWGMPATTSQQVSTIGGWSIGLGIAFAAVFIVMFYIYRKTLLSIEYAGGNIAFDAKLLQSGEQDTFIRNIHLAKDKLYSMAAVEQGFVSDEEHTETT